MIDSFSFCNWETYINEYIDSFLYSDEISSVIHAFRVCNYYFQFVKPVYSLEQLTESSCNFTGFDAFTWLMYA